MEEIVIRTLADLEPGFGLYGYCDAGGRMERLERKALIRALGWDAELERIRRGLRCGECGARDGLLCGRPTETSGRATSRPTPTLTTTR